MIEYEIEKLVNGGEGLGFDDNTAVFAWNALPGERVRLKSYSRKKDFIRGIAEEILEPSPHRVPLQEDHYLSCSPWQILSFEEENRWKGIIAAEVFERLAGIELGKRAVVHDMREYGYRNKMEYSFWEENGRLSLAFFVRGKNRRMPIDPCLLAQEPINRATKEVLAWMNDANFLGCDVKTVILRSGDCGKVIASLLVVRQDAAAIRIALGNREPFTTISGFSIYLSDPKSPSSIPLDFLHQEGSVELTQTVLKTPLTFGAFNFFQINVLLFERALQAIAANFDDSEVVDFYSGVGAISIPLSKSVSRAILVESDSSATAHAARVIEAHGLRQYSALNNAAESLLSEIQKNRIIIVDPPRAGLHKDIIARLLEIAPRRVIYLSCDVATQARDVALLLPRYLITHNELYNFFPRTPHIESLIVLDAR